MQRIMLSDPRSQQGVVVQACRKYFPTGFRLNMVWKVATSSTRISAISSFLAISSIAAIGIQLSCWRCARSRSGITALA